MNKISKINLINLDLKGDQSKKQTYSFSTLLKLKPQSSFKDYLRICETNKKQKQGNSTKAGLRCVLKSPGTNKGKSRQKYADYGYTSVVRGSPNNRSGRKALLYRSNQIKLNFNKKEKKLMIRSLIYETLVNSEIYIIDDKNLNFKTSQFFKKLNLEILKFNENSKVVKFLKQPHSGTSKKVGPVLYLGSQAQSYFRNFPNIMNLKSSPNYFGLYKGARLRNGLITTMENLQLIIEKYLK